MYKNSCPEKKDFLIRPFKKNRCFWYYFWYYFLGKWCTRAFLLRKNVKKHKIIYWLSSQNWCVGCNQEQLIFLSIHNHVIFPWPSVCLDLNYIILALHWCLISYPKRGLLLISLSTDPESDYNVFINTLGPKAMQKSLTTEQARRKQLW